MQDVCLEALDHPDAGVRGVAATCLGHLGRAHDDFDRVVEQLRRLAADPEVGGRARDALDDIGATTGLGVPAAEG